MKIYWSGESKNIIGAKIRALRLEKKWSQHDLATRVQLLGCECSDLTILRIEKGDRFVPDYEVKALAMVFNVSYESFLVRRLRRSRRGVAFHFASTDIVCGIAALAAGRQKNDRVSGRFSLR